jgi:hypothetical protein
MVGTSGGEVAAADVEALVVFLFFLATCLVLRIRFALMYSFRDGASWPVKGCVARAYTIGCPLMLLIGSAISTS